MSLERHVCVTVFNPDVLAFNIAEIAKALPERPHEAARRRRRSEKADRVPRDRRVPQAIGGRACQRLARLSGQLTASRPSAP